MKPDARIPNSESRFPFIDINCDMGEGCPNDESLLGLVSSASIACGVHAGSAELMRRTMSLAAARGVAVGAHPGLADAAGMGRREQPLTVRDAHDLVAAQVRAMQDAARELDVTVSHVKPHGAIYNQAARDAALADAVAQAVREADANLILFGLAGSELVRAGIAAGLRVASEAFADRRYRADGSLVPRSRPGAIIEDPADATAQVLRIVRDHKLVTVEGAELTVQADTICVHSDSPDSVEMVRRVREALFRSGIEVRRVAE